MKEETQKLNIPNSFWADTRVKYIAMDKNGEVWAYVNEPYVSGNIWLDSKEGQFSGKEYSIPLNFPMGGLWVLNCNPHNIPWDQSLTKRPEE